MAEDFDAYYLWLGIPPDEQPPDHYRLLGVRQFESNADVIDAAADRQMGHVQRYKIGAHSALSQRLLNELSAAKICLLKPDGKAAYDLKLRERIAAATTREPAATLEVPATPVPLTIVPRAAAPQRVVPLATNVPLATSAPLRAVPLAASAPLPATESWAVEPSRSPRPTATSRRSNLSNTVVIAGIAISVVLLGVAIRWISGGGAPEERSLSIRNDSATSIDTAETPPAIRLVDTPQEPIRPAQQESNTPQQPIATTDPPAAQVVTIPAATPEPPPAAPIGPASVDPPPVQPAAVAPPPKPAGPLLAVSERAAAEQFLQAGGRLRVLVDELPIDVSKAEELPARCMIVATIVVPDSLKNDAGIEVVRNFAQLTHLNLDYSGVTDAGLARLTSLKRLKAIGMYRAPVTDEGLKSLAQLTTLEELGLNSTRITNAGLAHLKPLKKLRHLGLGEIPAITGEALEHVRGLKELVSIDLNVTGVNDQALELVGSWTQLKNLNLFTTPITDAGLMHLHRLVNLETTEVGRTGVTDAGVVALQTALPKCRISRIP